MMETLKDKINSNKTMKNLAKNKEASKKENNAKSSVFNKKHHFLANISNKLGLSSVIYFK
jgi:hypothetical protein